MPTPKQHGTGRTVRVATYPGMPPFNFINSGKPSGLEIDILTEWANRNNWRLEFLYVDFASLIPAVQTDKADMAMGSIAATEERRKQVLFSDSYHEGRITLYTRKGELGILKEQTPQVQPEGDAPYVLWGTAAILIIIIGGGIWLFYCRKHPATSPATLTASGEGTEEERPIISISHLKKSFDALDVLHDISVDVHHGQEYVLRQTRFS